MQKLIIILSLIYSTCFAYCPDGCLDDPVNTIIYKNRGKENYNSGDQSMLNAFKEIADKMKNYYDKFENSSSELIENGAKAQYFEAVNSKEILLEMKKAVNLKNVESDVSAVKSNRNVKSDVK